MFNRLHPSLPKNNFKSLRWVGSLSICFIGAVNCKDACCYFVSLHRLGLHGKRKFVGEMISFLLCFGTHSVLVYTTSVHVCKFLQTLLLFWRPNLILFFACFIHWFHKKGRWGWMYHLIRVITKISRAVSTDIRRPGGTGPVGPAVAGPTFELGRIIFF